MKANILVEYLRDNGPSPSAELPREIRLEDKMAGVWRCYPNTMGRSAQAHGTLAVYYLKPEHTPVEVAAAWLDVNERLVDAAVEKECIRSLYMTLCNAGDEIGEAGKLILKERYPERWESEYTRPQTSGVSDDDAPSPYAAATAAPPDGDDDGGDDA